MRPWLANDRVFKTHEEIRKERPVMAAAQANHEQIRYWNEQSGPRWVKQQQRLDAQLDRLGLAAMQRAGVKPAEHVLDVGCGCGQTSLELAERVGPRGSVLGLDISQPMLARARERQNELRVQNLALLRADAQTYPLGRERFDLIFSRFGIMFFDDPPTAFRNLCAALRPLDGSALSAGRRWKRTSGFVSLSWQRPSMSLHLPLSHRARLDRLRLPTQSGCAPSSKREASRR